MQRTRTHTIRSTGGALIKGSTNGILPSESGQGTGESVKAPFMGCKSVWWREGVRLMCLLLIGWQVSLLGCGPAGSWGFSFCLYSWLFALRYF